MVLGGHRQGGRFRRHLDQLRAGRHGQRPGAGVGGENGIYARRFTAAGAPLAGEFLVNTFTAGNQQYSKVAMDEAGDFTITWESFQDPKNSQPNTSTTPTSYGIYAQRYVRTSLINSAQYETDANGKYESEFQVNTTQDGDQRYPGIAMDDNGDFVVLWSGNGQDAGTGTADSQGVFLQRFDLPNDATGPRVIDTYYNTTGSTSDNSPLTESEILTSQVQQITVTFSEAVDDIGNSAADQQNPLWATLWVHSVLNPANWTLTQNGGVVVDAVSSVQAVSGMPNTYVITFQNSLGTQGALEAYTLTASNVIQDAFGNDLNTLDGNLSGPGSSFTRSFSVDLLPAPAVTSVSPSRGPVAGGTQVTITGTNLSNATAVKFGTVSILAANFISSTATQIVVTSPAGVAGSTVNVMVVTASGISDTNANDTFTYVAVPTVASVAPQAGPATGNTQVTITGTGLLYATAVYFGTVQGTIVASTTPSDNTLTVLSPAGAAGTVDVTVVTAGGTSVTSTADQFTYVATPTVAGINPTAGPVGGNTTVTIYGTNLTGATAVYFGTIPATISSISANQIVAITQPGVAGTVDVTVVTTGGTSAISAADQYTYAPVPVVTGVSPSSGPASGGTAVTIIGTGLANATAVYFIDAGGNKTSATIVAGSDTATQLVVTSPASAAAGIVDIEVVTAGGSATDKVVFTYLPIVTGISPAAGLVVSPVLTTALASAVTGGSTDPNYTQITVTDATSFLPTSGISTPFVIRVNSEQMLVTGMSGTSDTTWTVLRGFGGTAVSSHVQNAVVSGFQAAVTITGAGLKSATAVKFGDISTTSFTVVSDNQIVVAVPENKINGVDVPATVDVTVDTNVGWSTTSAADLFTYVQAPAVTGVSPSAGPAAGGIQVTITGTWLANATAVYFVDTTTGTEVDTLATIVPGSNTGTQLTVISPKGVAGDTVGIKVVTVSGSDSNWKATAGDQFTYVAAPTVSSVTVDSGPATGPAGGGTTVTIQGTNLTSATAVYFGSVLATIVAGSDTGTQLHVVSPPGVAGTVDVTVVTVGGASPISAADEFTYIAAPTVTSISPSAGPVGTTTTLKADISKTATTITVADASQFPAASGSFPFIIQVDGEQMLVGGGGSGLNATWTILQRGYDNTTAASHSQNTVVTGGLTTVTIQGTNLANATAVYFGTALATIISDGANQIVVTSPAGIAGTVDVTVTTTGGTSATLAVGSIHLRGGADGDQHRPHVGSGHGRHHGHHRRHQSGQRHGRLVRRPAGHHPQQHGHATGGRRSGRRNRRGGRHRGDGRRHGDRQRGVHLLAGDHGRQPVDRPADGRDHADDYRRGLYRPDGRLLRQHAGGPVLMDRRFRQPDYSDSACRNRAGHRRYQSDGNGGRCERDVANHHGRSLHVCGGSKRHGHHALGRSDHRRNHGDDHRHGPSQRHGRVFRYDPGDHCPRQQYRHPTRGYQSGGRRRPRGCKGGDGGRDLGGYAADRSIHVRRGTGGDAHRPGVGSGHRRHPGDHLRREPAQRHGRVLRYIPGHHCPRQRQRHPNHGHQPGRSQRDGGHGAGDRGHGRRDVGHDGRRLVHLCGGAGDNGHQSDGGAGAHHDDGAVGHQRRHHDHDHSGKRQPVSGRQRNLPLHHPG